MATRPIPCGVYGCTNNLKDPVNNWDTTCMEHWPEYMHVASSEYVIRYLRIPFVYNQRQQSEIQGILGDSL